MFITREAAIRGVKNYIGREIANKSSGLSQFAIYFALPSLDRKIGAMYDSFSSGDLFCDMFQDGKLDLDVARDRAYSALESAGGRVQIDVAGLNVNMKREDIDLLYGYISEG